MLESEEHEALVSHLQVHDPRLGLLRLQAELGQQFPKPRQRGFGLRPGLAHHHQVVGETHQYAVLPFHPCPVEPVQVDVAERGADHPALGCAGRRPVDLSVLQDSRAQDHPQKRQHGLVADAFLDRLHQLVDRDRLEAVGDVRLDHPTPAPPGLVDENLEGIVRRAPRAEPVAARQEVRLEHRLKHDLHSGLHDPVADRRDRQRPGLRWHAGLRDEDPPCREWPIPAVPQIRCQLVEQPGDPVLLDCRQGDFVNTRCTVVATHRDPPPP
ncbi:hypothetical protein ABH941_000004 [Streptacidiphilus sp. EB103A]